MQVWHEKRGPSDFCTRKDDRNPQIVKMMKKGDASSKVSDTLNHLNDPGRKFKGRSYRYGRRMREVLSD